MLNQSRDEQGKVGGVLTLGGTDPSHYEGPVTYAPLTNVPIGNVPPTPEPNFWQFSLDG